MGFWKNETIEKMVEVDMDFETTFEFKMAEEFEKLEINFYTYRCAK